MNFEFDLIPDSLNLKLINLYLFVSAMEIFDIEKKKIIKKGINRKKKFWNENPEKIVNIAEEILIFNNHQNGKGCSRMLAYRPSDLVRAAKTFHHKVSNHKWCVLVCFGTHSFPSPPTPPKKINTYFFKFLPAIKTKMGINTNALYQ